MKITIFGKKYLIVFPFQKKDATDWEELDKTVICDVLWVMKWGDLYNIKSVTVNGKLIISK